MMNGLSYVHGTADEPLVADTIGNCLARTAARFGSRDAVVARHQGVRLTYGELYELTGRVGRGLMAHGLGRGDRLGIWSTNRSEWLVLQFAAARIGAVLTTINPAYRPPELAYALQHSGASVLIMARGFRQTDWVAMLASVRPDCPNLHEAIVIDDDWNHLLSDADHVSVEDLEAREASLQFDDPINIQYTSGTTGRPKGATLSHHNIVNNARFFGAAMAYSEVDRICAPVPLYHTFGMVLSTLTAMEYGACVVLPAESFDPAATLTSVEEERCTSLYGVPTMFIALLEHPLLQSTDVSSLRTGLMAGAPCPVEVMQKDQSRLHMPQLMTGCGMTELSPAAVLSPVTDTEAHRLTTVGTALPHVEVKLIDPTTGRIVSRGIQGEMCARGYNVMLGYWDDPEASREAIDAGRWMHTGDLATMDPDGYVHITGRLKDMIIRGGENIYPREIEECLYGHAAVTDVQVIGIPDARYGEEVMAWVKLRAGENASADDLAAFCRERLASHKVPRQWRFVDGFPMTVTGKVQKFVLREMAIEQLGLQAAAGGAA
jgi:fatty-acyl-CoA synthase